MTDKVKEAIELLEGILNDRGVPRNIKSSIEESMSTLNDPEESENVKLSTVISILDDASNDPNISLYARTKMWDVVSKLEELNR
ncbi:MAG: UPF0147 family protein [Candidatus Aenigmarchaeota archaeon]|nr:UPF0147 family protein [Candidatus Aenigmarchaeota archaeon]